MRGKNRNPRVKIRSQGSKPGAKDQKSGSIGQNSRCRNQKEESGVRKQNRESWVCIRSKRSKPEVKFLESGVRDQRAGVGVK